MEGVILESSIFYEIKFKKTSKRLTVDIFASLISIDVGSDIGPRSSLVKYTKHTSNCKKKDLKNAK